MSIVASDVKGAGLTVVGSAITSFSINDAASRLIRCCSSCAKEILRKAALRPTRQSIAPGQLLFTNVPQHVTAEMLREEAVNAQVAVSLTTIYNTLHNFPEAGLLRQVSIDALP